MPGASFAAFRMSMETPLDVVAHLFLCTVVVADFNCLQIARNHLLGQVICTKPFYIVLLAERKGDVCAN